jgi:hypothetical protein
VQLTRTMAGCHSFEALVEDDDTGLESPSWDDRTPRAAQYNMSVFGAPFVPLTSFVSEPFPSDYSYTKSCLGQGSVYADSVDTQSMQGTMRSSERGCNY